MKMALDDNSGVNLVRAYEPGRVHIREQTYTESLIALPDRLFAGWEAESAKQLRAAHFKPLLEVTP